jgi:hypothetical protein
MKITHIAIAGIVILLVAAGYLMMDSANDKKFAAQQDKLNQMMEAINKLKAPAPAPAPEAAPAAPAAEPAMVAAPVPSTVAAAPKPKLGPAPTLPVNPAPAPGTAVPAVAPAPGTPGAGNVTLPNPAAALTVAAQEKQLLDEQIAQLKDQTAPPTYTPLQLQIKNLPAIAKIKSYNSELAFVEMDAGKNRNIEKGMTFDIRRDSMLVGKVTVSDTVEDSSSIADVDVKTIPTGVQIQAGDELVKYK